MRSGENYEQAIGKREREIFSMVERMYGTRRYLGEQGKS